MRAKKLKLSTMLKKTFIYPLAIGILGWQELFYKPINHLGTYLARHPNLAKIQKSISQLPPAAALATLVIPAVILFPLKMLALAFLAQGHALMGGAVFLGAKVVGAALFTRLFTLTEPQIRKFPLLNTALNQFFDKKDKMVTYWKSSVVYGHLHQFKLNVRSALKRVKQSLFGQSKEGSDLTQSTQNVEFLAAEKKEIKDFIFPAPGLHPSGDTVKVRVTEQMLCDRPTEGRQTRQEIEETSLAPAISKHGQAQCNTPTYAPRTSIGPGKI